MVKKWPIKKCHANSELAPKFFSSHQVPGTQKSRFCASEFWSYKTCLDPGVITHSIHIASLVTVFWTLLNNSVMRPAFTFNSDTMAKTAYFSPTCSYQDFSFCSKTIKNKNKNLGKNMMTRCIYKFFEDIHLLKLIILFDAGHHHQNILNKQNKQYINCKSNEF